MSLAQAEGEDDEMAISRMLAQDHKKMSLLPFNPHIESVDEFYSRVPRAKA